MGEYRKFSQRTLCQQPRSNRNATVVILTCGGALHELAKEGGWIHVVSHRGEGHQPPPEAVVEGPAPGLRSLSLNGKDEAGVEEDGHNHDHKQQAKL